MERDATAKFLRKSGMVDELGRFTDTYQNYASLFNADEATLEEQSGMIPTRYRGQLREYGAIGKNALITTGRSFAKTFGGEEFVQEADQYLRENQNIAPSPDAPGLVSFAGKIESGMINLAPLLAATAVASAVAPEAVVGAAAARAIPAMVGWAEMVIQGMGETQERIHNETNGTLDPFAETGLALGEVMAIASLFSTLSPISRIGGKMLGVGKTATGQLGSNIEKAAIKSVVKGLSTEEGASWMRKMGREYFRPTTRMTGMASMTAQLGMASVLSAGISDSMDEMLTGQSSASLNRYWEVFKESIPVSLALGFFNVHENLARKKSVIVPTTPDMISSIHGTLDPLKSASLADENTKFSAMRQTYVNANLARDPKADIETVSAQADVAVDITRNLVYHIAMIDRSLGKASKGIMPSDLVDSFSAVVVSLPDHVLTTLNDTIHSRIKNADGTPMSNDDRSREVQNILNVYAKDAHSKIESVRMEYLIQKMNQERERFSSKMQMIDTTQVVGPDGVVISKKSGLDPMVDIATAQANEQRSGVITESLMGARGGEVGREMRSGAEVIVVDLNDFSDRATAQTLAFHGENLAITVEAPAVEGKAKPKKPTQYVYRMDDGSADGVFVLRLEKKILQGTVEKAQDQIRKLVEDRMEEDAKLGITDHKPTAQELRYATAKVDLDLIAGKFARLQNFADAWERRTDIARSRYEMTADEREAQDIRKIESAADRIEQNFLDIEQQTWAQEMSVFARDLRKKMGIEDTLANKAQAVRERLGITEHDELLAEIGSKTPAEGEAAVRAGAKTDVVVIPTEGGVTAKPTTITQLETAQGNFIRRVMREMTAKNPLSAFLKKYAGVVNVEGRIEQLKKMLSEWGQLEETYPDLGDRIRQQIAKMEAVIGRIEVVEAKGEKTVEGYKELQSAMDEIQKTATGELAKQFKQLGFDKWAENLSKANPREMNLDRIERESFEQGPSAMAGKKEGEPTEPRKTTLYAFYLPTQRLGVFMDRATPERWIHEITHHILTSGMLPEKIKQMLVKEFGSKAEARLGTPIVGETQEKIIDGIFWMIQKGQMPKFNDSNTATAYGYLRSVLASIYTTDTRILPPLNDSAAKVIEKLVYGTNITKAQDAVGAVAVSHLKSNPPSQEKIEGPLLATQPAAMAEPSRPAPVYSEDIRNAENELTNKLDVIMYRRNPKYSDQISADLYSRDDIRVSNAEQNVRNKLGDTQETTDLLVRIRQDKEYRQWQTDEFTKQLREKGFTNLDNGPSAMTEWRGIPEKEFEERVSVPLKDVMERIIGVARGTIADVKGRIHDVVNSTPESERFHLVELKWDNPNHRWSWSPYARSRIPKEGFKPLPKEWTPSNTIVNMKPFGSNRVILDLIGPMLPPPYARMAESLTHNPIYAWLYPESMINALTHIKNNRAGTIDSYLGKQGLESLQEMYEAVRSGKPVPREAYEMYQDTVKEIILQQFTDEFYRYKLRGQHNLLDANAEILDIDQGPAAMAEPNRKRKDDSYWKTLREGDDPSKKGSTLLLELKYNASEFRDKMSLSFSNEDIGIWLERNPKSSKKLEGKVEDRAAEAGYKGPFWHGGADVYIFDPIKVSGRTGDFGIHVSTDRAVGRLLKDKRTTSKLHKLYIKADNPLRLLDRSVWTPRSIGKQMVEKGLISSEKAWDDMLAEAEKRHIGEPFPSQSMAALRDILKEMGFDSIIYLNRYEVMVKAEGTSDAHYISSFFELYEGRDTLSDADFKAKHPTAADAYLLFDSEQVKSGDPITLYNMENKDVINGSRLVGEVVPLSSRFDYTDPDISAMAEPASKNFAKDEVGAEPAEVRNEEGMDSPKNRTKEWRRVNGVLGHKAVMDIVGGWGYDSENIQKLTQGTDAQSFHDLMALSAMVKSSTGNRYALAREAFGNPDMNALTDAQRIALALMMKGITPEAALKASYKKAIKKQIAPDIRELVESEMQKPQSDHMKETAVGVVDGFFESMRNWWRSKVLTYGYKNFTDFSYQIRYLDDMLREGPWYKNVGYPIEVARQFAASIHQRMEVDMLSKLRELGINQNFISNKKITLGPENDRVTLAKVALVYLEHGMGDPRLVNDAQLQALKQSNPADAPAFDAMVEYAKGNEQYSERVRNYAKLLRWAYDMAYDAADVTYFAVNKKHLNRVHNYIPQMREDGMWAENDPYFDLMQIDASTRTMRDSLEPIYMTSRSQIKGSSIRINEPHRTLVDHLNAVANYAGKAEAVLRVRSILNDSAVKEALNHHHRGAGRYIWHALNEMISGEMKPTGRLEKMTDTDHWLQKIRLGFQSTVMGFSPKPVLSQVVSLLNGLAETPGFMNMSNIRRMAFDDIPSIMSVMNRNHGENFRRMTSGDYKTMGYLHPLQEWTGKNGQSYSAHPIMEYWRKYASHILERHGNPQTADVEIRSYPGLMGIEIRGVPLGEIAFTGLKSFDLFTTAVTWWNGFQNVTKVLQNGPEAMSLEQAQVKAAEYMNKTTMDTQSPSVAHEKTAWQRGSEWKKGSWMFSGQTSKLFQYYTYDLAIPLLRAIKNRNFREIEWFTHFKNGVPQTGMLQKMTFAYVLPALAMGFIARGREPTEEEAITDMLFFPVASAPVLGSAIAGSLMYDWRSLDGSPVYVRLGNDVVKTIFDSSTAVKDYLKGRPVTYTAKEILPLVELLNTSVGFPKTIESIAYVIGREFLRDGWQSWSADKLREALRIEVQPTADEKALGLDVHNPLAVRR
jgi:hypothetical protein